MSRTSSAVDPVAPPAARWERGYLRSVVELGAVAILYFASARLGLALAFETQQVTAVWPPTGIALAAILLLGRRVWPGVFVGAFAANALADEALGTAAAIAAGNTLGPLLGAYLLRRFAGFDSALGRGRDVLALVVLGALVAMTVTATNGVINLALAGIIPWSSCGSVWRLWWVGDVMGVLVVAPLTLSWATPLRRRWRGWRVLEGAALLVSLSAVCLLGLTTLVIDSALAFHIKYAVFPFFIWAALRFGQRGGTAAAAMVAGFAVWGAIHEQGSFTVGTLDERLLLLQVFIAASCVTTLMLAAVDAEREHARAELERAHGELEVRVQERTAELAGANSALAQKNEEVEAFVYFVSHDLRAPLVNLQGFSRELDGSCRDLDGKLRAIVPADSLESVRPILDEEIPGALRYIATSTAKFQRLIESLLMFSRKGRESYRMRPLDVQALVATTLGELRFTIETSGAQVTVGTLPGAHGDATAIGQVFANLIGNAIKYLSPGRSGRIHIAGASEDRTAHYSIEDNGVGLPPRAMERVFQVFQRFHPELAPGDGMGLAIVKRMVERHGGTVWVESQEGVGTTFHFTLPAAGRTSS